MAPALTRLNSLLVASEIKRSGLDVILQLTGRDRNQIALESVLLGALSVGINKNKPRLVELFYLAQPQKSLLREKLLL